MMFPLPLTKKVLVLSKYTPILLQEESFVSSVSGKRKRIERTISLPSFMMEFFLIQL